VRTRGLERTKPRNKRGFGEDALGRRKGLSRSKKSRDVPKHPSFEECLKEPHNRVRSERPAPIPDKTEKVKVKKVYKPRDSIKSRPSRSIDKQVNNLIDRGLSPERRTFRSKKPKVMIKYQKWELDEEPWNLKRSPRLRQLKKAKLKVKYGRNPFFQFKDLFSKVKIQNLGVANRYMTILKGGLLLTKRSIGTWVTPQIRRVASPSFRELEIIISKLPFWATSYSFPKIRKLAFLVKHYQVSVGNHAKQCHTKTELDLPPGPTMLRGAYYTTYQPTLVG
jgi:hypothetical protein